MSNADHIRREDVFIYGYTHYKLKNYKKAAGILDKISFEEDTLKQMSLFTQAECYLQQGKKQEALQMYQQSVEIGLHPQYTEIAKYDYARLAYELGQDKEALNAAYNFVKQFPQSVYKEDCYKLITALAEQTENYTKVIELYQKLEQNKITQTSLQRLNYNLGQELFEAKKYQEALEAFQQAQALKQNNEVTSMATFWIAESYYQLKKYGQSIAAAKSYLIDPAPAIGDVSDNGAYMLLAYNYLDLNRQDSAIYYVNYIKSRNDKKFYDRYKYYLDRLYNTVDQLSIITARRDEILNQYYNQIFAQPAMILKSLDSAMMWPNNAPNIQEKINNYKAIALYNNKDTMGTVNWINAIKHKKMDEVQYITAEIDIAKADSARPPLKALEYVSGQMMDEFRISILMQLVKYYKRTNQLNKLNEYWAKIESKIYTIPANQDLINQFNNLRNQLLEEKIVNE
jgi:tetratricopeptide (TPR) repeat protein